MVALDLHMHPALMVEAVERGEGLLRATRRVLKIGARPQLIEVLSSQTEVADIERMVLPASDCTTRAGGKLSSNETVSWLASRSGVRFLGLASVDLNPDERAASELETGVRGLRLRGLKVSPPMRGFDPSLPKLRLAILKTQGLRIPAVIHVGFSYAGGCKLAKCSPLALEKRVAEFPELTFILVHFGWPWVWGAVTLAVKYPNVYLNPLNVYTESPEEHLRCLLTEAVPRRTVEGLPPDRIFLGSDYPRIEPDRVARAVKGLPLDPEVKRATPFERAAALLRIS